MRVLRIYHGGRDPAHLARERALATAHTDVTLVVPSEWPGTGSVAAQVEPAMTELPIVRAGDVNRHAYRDRNALSNLIDELKPDLLDIHEEPFSLAGRQWLAAAPVGLPIVMYTAQNVDKRLPPPFAQYEQAAHRRVSALYPCSAQAASVARGKGFAGLIEVLPLGYDESFFVPGAQSLDDDELVMALFGRLVPEKGVADAVRILARVHASRPTRLIIVGSGPEEATARLLAAELGVADRLEVLPWQPVAELASTYREAHVLLVPSRPTETWVEQFGRVIVEAQASGAVVAGYSSGSILEVAGEEAAVLSGVGRELELADRIVELADDAAEYGRRRAKGIELSRSRTWASVAAAQAELYRRVYAGRKLPPASPGFTANSSRDGAEGIWTYGLDDRWRATVRGPVASPRWLDFGGSSRKRLIFSLS